MHSAYYDSRICAAVCSDAPVMSSSHSPRTTISPTETVNPSIIFFSKTIAFPEVSRITPPSVSFQSVFQKLSFYQLPVRQIIFVLWNPYDIRILNIRLSPIETGASLRFPETFVEYCLLPVLHLIITYLPPGSGCIG